MNGPTTQQLVYQQPLQQQQHNHKVIAKDENIHKDHRVENEISKVDHRIHQINTKTVHRKAGESTQDRVVQAAMLDVEIVARINSVRVVIVGIVENRTIEV